MKTKPRFTRPLVWFLAILAASILVYCYFEFKAISERNDYLRKQAVENYDYLERKQK